MFDIFLTFSSAWTHSYPKVACKLAKFDEEMTTIRTETITNENLGIFFFFFRCRFCNGKANKFHQIFFRFRFHNEHVGHTHKPQQQAALVKIVKIQEILFCLRFRNPRERKSKSSIVFRV